MATPPHVPAPATIAALRLRFNLADFVRIAAGTLDPAVPLLADRASFEGDFALAARVPEMFGSPERLLAETQQRRHALVGPEIRVAVDEDDLGVLQQRRLDRGLAQILDPPRSRVPSAGHVPARGHGQHAVASGHRAAPAGEPALEQQDLSTRRSFSASSVASGPPAARPPVPSPAASRSSAERSCSRSSSSTTWLAAART